MQNFEHTGGFTLSLTDGEFDVSKLPKEYRRILKNAGVRKKDLKNPKKREIIFKQLEQQLQEIDNPQ